MKIDRKTLILVGIIFVNGLFLISIFSQYMFFSVQSIEVSENINFYEPSREIKIQLLQKGKTVVIIYNYSEVSIDSLREISNIFSKNVYFFLVNSSIPQAFIISPIREERIFNLTYENLFREICKVSLDVPKECLEII